MPKELIYSMDHGRHIEIEDEDGKSAGVHLMDNDAIRLGWSKESEHVGLCVIDSEKDPDGMEDGVRYINLDRYGINRLIKSLRKARDDAFGRDE